MDHHLRTFVTVAEKKNFTRAAEVLHVTQSAVTLTIKMLEKKFGVKLLDRTNKYVRLTKAGEILYVHAKEILNQFERVHRLIDDLSNVAAGPLLIGSSFTFGEYLLPRLISEFKLKYPLIMPSISIRNTKRIVGQLLQYELDLGIVEGDVSHPDLIIQSFTQDEMFVIVSANHPLAGRKEVYMEELASETWITREEGSGTRQTIDLLFAKSGFFPASAMSFGSSQVIKESVEAGLGISIMSQCVIRKELLLGTLCPIRIQNYPIVRNFSYAIHNTEFHAKVMDIFLEFLKSYPITDLLTPIIKTE